MNTPNQYSSEQITLSLYSKAARNFVTIFPPHEQNRLQRFTTRLHRLCVAHRADDAYADWFILQTYDAYSAAVDELTLFMTQSELLLKNLSGIEWEQTHQPNMMKYTHNFQSSLDFIGVLAIKEVDNVMRRFYLLKRLGLIHEIAGSSANKFIRLIHNIFNIARAWRATHITREDIANNTEKAQQCRALWGEVPENILKKKVDFLYW